MDSLVPTLKKKGYAIVPDVLDEATCSKIIDGMWDHAEYMSMGRISRTDPSTWKTELQNTFYPNHGMLMQHQWWGHSKIVWDVRCDARVVEGYKRIFPGCSKFTVSYDGVSFGLAPEVTGIGWHHSNWLHLDQGWGKVSYRRNAVQSWVTAYDIDEGDGTLQVLEGSHKLHKKFARKFGYENHKKNWLKLSEEEVQWYIDEGCQLVNVTCKAGSQVFWDSRTVHAGRAPLKRRANAGRHRFVIYLCYAPYSWMSAKARAKKKKALLEGRMTSHWPHYPTLFPKHPWTRGKKLRELGSSDSLIKTAKHFVENADFLPILDTQTTSTSSVNALPK